MSDETDPLEEQLLKEQKTPEEVNKAKEDWEKFFLNRAPMFGLDPAEVKFNYEWRTASGQWRKIVAPPSTAAKRRNRTAEILLTPAAKEKFERWRRSELNVPSSTDYLEIPEQLELAFRSKNPEDVSRAAQEIAVIGKRRLSAYFDSIEHVGERVREYAGHIQRWWALNLRGEQHVEAESVAKLQAMLKAGTPESVIEWATKLESLRYDRATQFDIHPVRVRSEGTIYGTINVDKKKLYRTLQQYSNQLADLCAPIYEQLEALSTYINGYFLQNRVADAFKAQSTAQNLSQHTERLARKAEK